MIRKKSFRKKTFRKKFTTLELNQNLKDVMYAHFIKQNNMYIINSCVKKINVAKKYALQGHQFIIIIKNLNFYGKKIYKINNYLGDVVKQ